MRFGRWYPLAEAASHAPSTPGVFQVRLATGLVAYPSGKSAMVHYAGVDDLGKAIAAFAAAHAGANWLCRHSIEPSPDATADPRGACERLVLRFARQFGSPPAIPA